MNDEKRNNIMDLRAKQRVLDVIAKRTLPNGVRAPWEAPALPVSTESPGESTGLSELSAEASAFELSTLDVAEHFISQFASPATRRTMRQGLERCARILELPFEGLPWEELRYEHTSYVRAKLLAPGAYERSSIELTLVALRGVLRHAYRLRRIPGEDFQRATDWGKLPKRETPLRGRELTQEELDRLRAFWEADPGPYGRFLAATFALLMGTGLRASEVCRMPLGAYDQQRGYAFVLRKGGKKVWLPLGAEERAALDEWIPVRDSYARRVSSGALLLRMRSNDWVEPKRPELDVKALEFLCGQLAKKLGIPHFTPHDFRRTFATRAGRAGIDQRAIQWFMSHEDPATTARYDMRKVEEFASVRRRVNLWMPPPRPANDEA